MRGTLGDIDPAAIYCSRNEDSERLIRMDASRPEEWSNTDIDLTIWRATTTIISEKIVARILPEFLRRVIREPDAGWMTSGDVVRQKLERSHFATWAEADREAVLALLPLYIATPDTDSESLAVWLDAFSRKDT
ncbi:hypothetical protein [Brevundimonas sp. SL130]|uniref:hypothetical protein n=1 Tax=Brevundimonas sp. SL130 TaxID=2995143 RepID=UPI00226C996F|nr:hypothetical protein [Brevundimonas sp. SL130]WAC59258.1 hypothetical protein OU998_13680 [Brevundimonas sp. SL130]